jgi:hypothetical protein
VLIPRVSPGSAQGQRAGSVASVSYQQRAVLLDARLVGERGLGGIERAVEAGE